MSYKTITYELNDGIGVLTINRPNALNALNSTVFDEIDQVVAEINSSTDTKILIITGGGKAFIAGADIAEMVNMAPEQGTTFSQKGQATFASLTDMEIPVIAAINGFALGGGLECAMACDFRIASTKAKFGQPEVNLGLIPGYNGTGRLPRLVGMGNALYLLMTGDMIDAQEAYRMGLVQKLCEPEELMETVYNVARLILSKGPSAIQKVKHVVHNGMLTDVHSSGKFESQEFGSLFGEKSEGREGMKAFLDKRPPKWK